MFCNKNTRLNGKVLPVLITFVVTLCLDFFGVIDLCVATVGFWIKAIFSIFNFLVGSIENFFTWMLLLAVFYYYKNTRKNI